MFTRKSNTKSRGSSRTSNSSRRNRKFRMESLESREMLSAVSLLNDGTLTITGSDAADEISAYVEADVLTVVVNGVSLSLSNDDISHINVSGGGGDDVIHLDDSVQQTTVLKGGAGNDMIDGGGGADRIDGGSGNDTITGGRGNDKIQGGWG